MSWIERLKKALWSAQAEYKFMHDDGVDSSRKYSWEDLAEFMYKRTQDALAVIPDEDPMIKLLRWLRGSRLKFQTHGLPTEYGAIITDIINHIEQEFGYTLPKEQ